MLEIINEVAFTLLVSDKGIKKNGLGGSVFYTSTQVKFKNTFDENQYFTRADFFCKFIWSAESSA